MSQPRYRTALELLAAGGVVVSLVFVGLEIRQNTAAVRGATYQAIADASVQNVQWLGSDERLVGLMARVADGEGPDDFSAEENIALSAVYHSNLRRIENVYLQVSEGLISRKAYRHFRPGRGSLFFTPYFEAVWPEYRGGFEPDFRLFFEGEYLE